VLNDVGEIWCWDAMSQIGGTEWYDGGEHFPGRRVARVTTEGLVACDPRAAIDPCHSDHDVPIVEGPTEVL
jgi:hypothetical protein